MSMEMRTRSSNPLWVLFLSVAWVATMARETEAQEAEVGFTSLFDGATLTGWMVEGGEESSFSVVDGAIHIGGPRGWLRSTDRYSNFTLRLEFRLMEGGTDSGVFFRAATLGGFGREWPNRSYQIQLRDMHAPSMFLPLGHIYRHGMPRGESNHQSEIARDGYRGVREWHRLQIDVEGDNVQVELDGEVILTAGSIGNADGYIGFQAERGEVEYRSIRIRPR